MSFSQWIDWSEALKDCDKWENLGRRALEENCKHKDQDKDSNKNNRETNIRYSGYCEKCDVCEDSVEPMMNYSYPLETEPSEDKILEVVRKTNCTVMYNSEQDAYFLTLCGGGMDLSQDIALAYIILEKWIPIDLILSVCKQPFLSTSKKDFLLLAKEIISQLQTSIVNLQSKKEEWETSLIKAKVK